MPTINETRRRRPMTGNINAEISMQDHSPPSNHSLLDRKQDRHKSQSHDIQFIHWILIFGLSLTTVWGVMTAHSWVPEPLQPHDDSDVIHFSETRSRDFVERISALGPKPAASHELEVLASDMIIQEIEQIRRNADRVHRIELDIHRPSGCYNLERHMFDGFTLCYKNVLNLVVRLGDANRGKPSDHSLLVNCHFDTWPTSPGASDDAVSCGVMIEVLRVMSQQKTVLPHDVIFLFNGAEENILMAAHGFITQHPWRHQIRAFVNLEAAGSGGREMLFQAGPGNQWILNTYLEAAPRPHCSVMGQEVFDAGIVPGVTDFRIFRDFGLDLAFIRNGYVYHTEFDQPRLINHGSIQRAGENALHTIIALAKSDSLAHPSMYKQGQSVFFDLIGLFTVVYSFEMGEIINSIVLAYVVVRILYMTGQNHFKRREMDCANYYSLRMFATAYTVQVELYFGLPRRRLFHYYSIVTLNFYVALLSMLATVLLCSIIVVKLDASLCWYGHPSILIMVYILPALITALAVHSFARRYFVNKASLDVIECCVFDAQLAVNCGTLLFMTLAGFASAYFWMLTTAAPFSRIIVHTVYKYIYGQHERGIRRILLHFICVAPALILVTYFTALVLDLFIPIMGRSLAINSEIPISMLCFLGAIGWLILFVVTKANNFQSSMVYVSDATTMKRLLVIMLAVFMLIYSLIALKIVGQPYHYDINEPKLRRLQVQHVERRFYHYNQTLKGHDSALIYLALDHRGVEELPEETGLNICEHAECTPEVGKYCDLPYYIAVSKIIPPHQFCWKRVPDGVDIDAKDELKLISRNNLPGDQLNLTFYAEGSDHMSLQITPQPGWRLADWSFKADVLYDTETSFVSLAHGQQPYKMIDGNNVTYSDWNFWIIMQRTPGPRLDESSVYIGMASHYVHGPRMHSNILNGLFDLIRQRRQETNHWLWAITPAGWNIQYVAGMF